MLNAPVNAPVKADTPTVKSEFPTFSDADVVINLGGGRIYHLHASVLRRNSTVFAEKLTEEKGAALSSRAKKEGITLRYSAELTGVTAQGDLGVMVLRVSYASMKTPYRFGL